jgi:hypothetical protein
MNGIPAHKQAANPAGLSKLPVTRKPPVDEQRPAYCKIPYIACKAQATPIQVQTGTSKRPYNISLFKNKASTAYISANADRQNTPQYHLGLVCSSTNDGTLRKQSPYAENDEE